MELLLFAIIELFVPLCVFAILALIDAVVCAVNLVAAVFDLLPLLAKNRSASPNGSDTAPTTAGKIWPRRIAWATGIILALLLLTVAVANSFFFADVVNVITRQVTKRTGIQISFREVTGSFWTGTFHFTGLSVARRSHPQSTFAITADKADVDISVTSLPWQRIVVDSLDLQGIRGDWEKLARADKFTPRRPFRIENFRLADMRVRYANRIAAPDAEPLTVNITSMRSTLLRSKWLAFDLLFLSNIDGTIDETAFQVVTDHVSDSRYMTRWRSDGMPVAQLKTLVGGPFRIFEKGLVDISIENRLTLKPENTMDMDWSLVIRDFKAKVPSGSSFKAKAALTPVVLYLNRKKERFELAFSYKWNEKEKKIEASSSDDLDDILDLGKRMLGTLADAAKKGGKQER